MNRLVEGLWLGERERDARGRTARQQLDTTRLFADARRWHEAARELSCARTMPAALPLYCQALVRFALAYEASHARTGRGASPLPRMADALKLVDEPLRRRGVGKALDQVIAASSHLPEDPPEDERALRALLASMEAVTCAASEAAQAPTLRDVLVARWLRVTAGAALLVALSMALIGWIRAPRNVARGKRISASSVVLGRPEALVNGAIEWGRFAFTTDRVPSAVTIDLGRRYDLVEARIYNRGDAYLDQQVPLQIETSVDGSSYSQAARCTDFFTQTTPCTASLRGTSAQFVRLSRHGEIALSEVEVFGR
jgi:hypothetical protein